MSAPSSCARAEILAGAIALGEAGDDDRRAYRAHISHCVRCVNALGGERDIERTMHTIARARDGERWQPDLRRAVLCPTGSSYRRRWAPALLTAIVAVLIVAVLQRHTVIPHRTALPAPMIATQQAAAIAAVGTQGVPAPEHRAESLQFRNGATLTLRVVLDTRGKPVRCTMVGHSESSLDRAICAAVMRSRP